MAGDEFSELLGRLKERSGLSYGVLGKRLHTSASTLHRYVNGDAVPTDYAPVERFARVCRATPEELVELHRRWILADARRRQKTGGAPAEEEPRERTAAEAGTGTAAPVARRRTAALAGTVVAAVLVVLVSATLMVSLLSGTGDDGRGGKPSTGAAASRSDEESPRASGPAGTKGTSVPRGGSPAASVPAARSGGPGTAPGGGFEDGAGAPTVAVNPYKWEDPCSQHYLLDRQPGQVLPPPGEPDARGWVTALGGVPGGRQMLALTVQGTGRATVVLEDLHVRVVAKSPPLAWNDFAMGVGCGGNVDTAAFRVDLDAGRPTISPQAGQRDFPYKVSESDPEVFHVLADARAYDVRWYLELDWSSGDQHGTVRIDDNGKPFRTSGNVGRPAYTHPLGSSEWGRDEVNPNIPG